MNMNVDGRHSSVFLTIPILSLSAWHLAQLFLLRLFCLYLKLYLLCLSRFEISTKAIFDKEVKPEENPVCFVSMMYTVSDKFISDAICCIFFSDNSCLENKV